MCVFRDERKKEEGKYFSVYTQLRVMLTDTHKGTFVCLHDAKTNILALSHKRRLFERTLKNFAGLGVL